MRAFPVLTRPEPVRSRKYSLLNWSVEPVMARPPANVEVAVVEVAENDGARR